MKRGMKVKQKWQKGKYALNAEGLAIEGYDLISYFSDGKPRVGVAEHEAEWSGAKWRFTSSANRNIFVTNPEMYAPQFGGLCAFAISFSGSSWAPPAPPGQPTNWKIVAGKLYLNANHVAHVLFKALGRSRKADHVWDKLSG